MEKEEEPSGVGRQGLLIEHGSFNSSHPLPHNKHSLNPHLCILPLTQIPECEQKQIQYLKTDEKDVTERSSTLSTEYKDVRKRIPIYS